ncbi:MAG TPA: glutathione S-transferase family protein, partial [Usitatibacteraceae bacterium]|nr:glutathione S-transferase family protein [Usitatibacteraceae bacterium]
MADLTLVIGNKNYSSWSMRPWVLLTQLGIPFEERKLRFNSDEWDAGIGRWSPSGLVPVLWRGNEAVWDSLAIMEAVAEWFPDKGVWPADPAARALARSTAAEMHAGFRNLRAKMPMSIRSRYPGKGMTPEVRADIDRIEHLWRDARSRFGSGGDFLFGRFSAADAMFAPVVMRFATYGVTCGPVSARYCRAMQAAAGVRAWIEGAQQETEFVAEDEPYAEPPRP